MNCEEIMGFRNKNSKFSAYLGIHITEMKPGYAKGEMVVAKHHENIMQSLHGGCLFSLADTIGGAASSSRGNRAITVSGDFHFLSPAIEVKRLTAIATEQKYGKKISVYDVAIFNEKEELLAKGIFTFYNLDA